MKESYGYASCSTCGPSTIENNVPMLLKHRHELFAQGLAKGLGIGAAYVAAGYKPSPAAATRLSKNVKLQGRVAELQAASAERATVTRQWVLERLKENVERSMQAAPVLDHDGNPTGEYKFAGNAANRALELLGKELGMFAQRPPGDEEYPLVLRAMADRPPDETREQWLARRQRELGIAPTLVVTATGQDDLEGDQGH